MLYLMPKLTPAAKAAKSLENKARFAKLQKQMRAEMKKTPPRIVGAIAKQKANNPLKIGNAGTVWDKQKVMDIVCKKVATSTFSLAAILRTPHEGFLLPDTTTLYDWMRADESLSLAYAQAKRSQARILVEEIIEIADDSSGDVQTRINSRTGKMFTVADAEFVARSRLRVDVRKWHASKMLPKEYGDTLPKDEEDDEVPMPIAVTIDFRDARRTPKE